MDLQDLFTGKATLCFTIIYIIFTTLMEKTISVDSKYEDCVPRNCGKGPNISYPFRLLHHQESYCGYPKFEVKCKDEHPVVTISSDDYVIRDLFYANNSFSLENAASFANNTCPIPLHNFSLDHTPFSFSPFYMALNFFYNCTTDPNGSYTHPVKCAANTAFPSFAVFHKNALDATGFASNSCQSWVNAPVDINDNNVDFRTLIDMNYAEILKLGFHLNWNLSNCRYCEQSGGHCGFEDNKFLCFCIDGPHDSTCNYGRKLTLWRKLLIGFGATIFAILAVTSISIILWRRVGNAAQHNDEIVEAFIKQHGSLALKRYRYSDIKKMTFSLKEKLGQGGYGSVYKGQLPDGRLVAVKILKNSKGNGEEFINEVASISRTSHVNIVNLYGYCFECHKRALIYEFMPNGSLDKFKDEKNLGLECLYVIASGIARGLEYLHHGCNTRILHLDIKPHNILLDDYFNPKIADFGLAKLCSTKDSKISSMLGARGTIGYIAPEVFNRGFGRVSHKSDIYSYGMMILEIVGEKEKIVCGVSESSDMYFPDCFYKHLDQAQNESSLEGVVMNEVESLQIARKMIIVGLWCIQTDPSHRPSITKVIEMLEGSVEALQIPPRPVLSLPSRLSADAIPGSYLTTLSMSTL